MVTDMTRSTRCCKPALMPDAFSARSLAWRHSRMPAAKVAAIGSFGCLPTSSYSFSSEPPDQKLSSKSAAWALSFRSLTIFSKMIAQHQTDAANSISMTALTTMSAAMNSPHTDRLWAVAVAAPEVRTEGSILVSLAH